MIKTQKNVALFPQLLKTVEMAQHQEISQDRKEVLKPLIAYIQSYVDKNELCHLNFICTHNSRRSQFSQIWAQTAADFYGIPVKSYSGGIEVTAFNHRAVNTVKENGFEVSSEGVSNPVYFLKHSVEANTIIAFSKLFDHEVNQSPQFAAVMTCSHADDNCPFIPGTEQRISVQYEDPKAFDDTADEAKMYQERSLQIASEMFFVFSQIKA